MRVTVHDDRGVRAVGELVGAIAVVDVEHRHERLQAFVVPGLGEVGGSPAPTTVLGGVPTS